MESAPPAVPDRSRQVLDDVQRQQRWTREALAAKPPPDELREVRDGDAEAVADTRKRFRRLVTAIERTTWIRETVDRKSTRLNSSHDQISYAVFCLKKKKSKSPT